jgi:hypothetical protein
MTNRRDIELLISARETTGRSFRSVVDNIDALNQKIAEQVAAAERGEGSLQDLRRSQEQLAQAGRDLSALQGQIDAYQRLTDQQEKNSVAARKAADDYQAMKAELAGLDAVTASQERKLAGLEKRQRTTSTAVEKTTTDLNAQREVLERAGLDVTKLDQAQTQIINSARQAGQGFSQLGVSMDAYADNLRQARDAEQQFAAQDAFDRKIVQARQLGDASQFVQLYANAVGMAKQTDNQLAALTGFRTVGQMAVEASRDISQFVTAGQTMAISTSDIATGLRAIIDPGSEALRTLSGVEAAVQAASTTAMAERQSIAAYSTALNELSAASAALVRQGGLVDAFKQQETQVALTRQQFDQAQAEVQQLGQAMAAAETPTEGLANDLKVAETRLQQVGRALNAEETKLGEMSRALRQAGIDTNNLAAAQQRLETSATQAANATASANNALGRGGGRRAGIFGGLTPFALQNLSFQINDVVVGLASGQKPMTVFLQQGLQITQLFPGLISGIARFALAWAPVIIVLGIAAAAVGKYVSEAVKLQAAQDALATAINGSAVDPARFVQITDALEGMGAKAEDAKAALLSMIEEGMDPARLDEYAAAAQNLAERLGVELSEATELLVNIQRGGIEAVEELTGKTHDLTEADLDHAQALFDAGKAAEARQFVLDRVAEKNAQIARATRSQWTPAVDNLKLAWSNFLGFLADKAGPVLDWLKTKVDNLVVGLTFMTGLLAGKGFEGALKQAQGVVLQQRGLVKPPAAGASGQAIRDRQFLRDLEEEYTVEKELTREQRLRRAEVDARRKAQAAGVSQAVEELAVTAAIHAEEKEMRKEAEQDAKKGAAASRKAEAARKKAAREAAAAQRKIDSTRSTLDSQLRQLRSATGRGASASLEERLRVVDEKYESIYDTISKLRNLGINTTADGLTLDTVERQVEASKERLKAEERLKYFEDQIGLLVTQRKEEIETISDAQERGAKSVATAYAEAEAVNDRISPQIVGAAQKALEIAKAIAGAEPSPEMAAMIARLERIVSGEATTDIVNKVGLDALEKQDSRINKLLSERNELIESYNTLRQIGLMGEAEFEQKATAAFAASSAQIGPLLEGLRQTVELLHQQRDALTGLPLLSDAAYNTWLAKIEAVNAGLVRQDTLQQKIIKTAGQALVQGITDGFNLIGQSIAGLIMGTKSLGDTFKDLGRGMLSIIGSIIDAIAQLLIKIIAVKIASAILNSIVPGSGNILSAVAHTGAVVGGRSMNTRRSMPAAAWIGAPRLHAGTGLGLRKDEYAAVLQRNEEVLTSDDPRHVDNWGRGGGGGGGGRAPQLKQVLLMDPAEVASAMQSRAGQRSVLTTIRANKETIKQVLR